MKFDLTSKEIGLLKAEGIPFDEIHDYTEDEALDLLDQVREIEVSYAQFTRGQEETMYFQYGNLADKIHSQISED